MTAINRSAAEANRRIPAPAAAALPVALALGFSLYRLWQISLTPAFGKTELSLSAFRLGSALWAGLPHAGVDYNMPLFETLFSLVFSLGASPNLVYAALLTVLYLLVFCAGAQLRGYRAGLASVLLAGLLPYAGRVGYNFEQNFYSLFLLLALNVLLLKKREDTPRNSLLLGLTIGASLLVRTPLFLFPAVLIALDLARGARLGPRQALLLGGCCAMLLPWAVLRYRVTGALGALDGDRGACNVLTAARGSVYTMKDECRRALGLAADAAPVRFYVSEALADPAFFARSVLRRAWHIFRFYPLLFCAFLAALALSREKDRALYFSLPVYFLAMHSLLAIEYGYFHPLLYLLPPLIAGTFVAPRPGGAAGGRAGALAAGGAWAALALTVPLQALLLAYPGRSAGSHDPARGMEALAARYPRNEAFRLSRCELLRGGADFAAYRSCLAGYGSDFLDPKTAYFAAVIVSTVPSALPFPPGSAEKIDYPVIRMLREFELGDTAAALGSFRQAYGVYEAWHDRLRGYLPGDNRPADEAAPLRLALNADLFWEKYVGDCLRLWPPAGAERIAGRLARAFPLTAGVKALRESAAPPAAPSRRAGTPPPAPVKHAAPGPAERFKELTGACVSAGAGPEAALRACQAALYMVESGSVPDSAENRRLAAAAARAGGRLLAAMGRPEEAAEMSSWMDKNAGARRR